MKTSFFTLLLCSFIGQALLAQTYIMDDNFVSDDSGTLYDSGGPVDGYGDNEDFIFIICPTGNLGCLNLNFVTFDVAEGDILLVYDGPEDSEDALLGSFTGGESPGTLSAESGCITVAFVSDDVSEDNDGFQLNWEVCPVPSACPEISIPPQPAICGAECVTISANVGQIKETTDYTVQEITYNPFPFDEGILLSVPIDDSWSEVVDLGFDFCFFGEIYDQIIVGTNGIISFNVADAGGYCEWPIDAPFADPDGVTNSIAFPFHDTDPSVGGTIFYDTFGEAPCRTFIVSYSEVPMFSCNELLATQQVVIYEGTNVIDVYMENKPLCPTWNSGEAILGIQNADGTQAVVPEGYNAVDNPNWEVTDEAWRFAPSGATDQSVVWFDATGAEIGTGNVIEVCPLETSIFDYTAEVTYNLCNGETLVLNDDITLAIGGDISLESNITVGQCGAANGAISLTVSGGSGDFSYEWSNAGITAEITDLQTGFYDVTVTDNADGGCVITETFFVECIAISVTGTSTPSSCDGLADGSISLTVDGGTPPFTYVWDNGTTTGSGDGLEILDLVAGTYNIDVTDASGNVASTSVEVGLNQTFAVAAEAVDASCENASDGSIVLTVTDGTEPYSFSYSGAAEGSGEGAQIDDLGIGTYDIVLTDANGCVANTAATVGFAATLSVSGIASNASCNGIADGSIALDIADGTAPFTYTYTGVSEGTGEGTEIVDLASGMYEVNVVDANGCDATTNVMVGADFEYEVLHLEGCDELSLTYTAYLSINGGALPYTVTGDYEGTITEDFEVTIAGIFDFGESYSLTVTDANGCVQSFEASPDCGTLPVELLRLTGEVTDNGNLVMWQVGSETNCDYYTVERSVNGNDFTYLGTVGGQGTTSQAQSYDLLDTNPPIGKAYYRLTQTDFDGTTYYLGSVMLNRAAEGGLQINEVLPVPAGDVLQVNFATLAAEKVTVNLFDVAGRLMMVNELDSQEGANNLSLDVSHLSTGVYSLVLRTNSEMAVQMIVKD